MGKGYLTRKGGGGVNVKNATAKAGEVLSGKTFFSGDKDIKTGTMPNRGGVNQVLAINGTYAIPEGYHDGNGKITQSIPTQAAREITPTSSDQVAIAAGTYASGEVKVKGVQLLANVGGTKRTYTIQTGAITAGNFVNTEMGITSNSPGASIGNEIVTSTNAPSNDERSRSGHFAVAILTGTQYLMGYYLYSTNDSAVKVYIGANYASGSGTQLGTVTPNASVGIGQNGYGNPIRGFDRILIGAYLSSTSSYYIRFLLVGTVFTTNAVGTNVGIYQTVANRDKQDFAQLTDYKYAVIYNPQSTEKAVALRLVTLNAFPVTSTGTVANLGTEHVFTYGVYQDFYVAPLIVALTDNTLFSLTYPNPLCMDYYTVNGDYITRTATLTQNASYRVKGDLVRVTNTIAFAASTNLTAALILEAFSVSGTTITRVATSNSAITGVLDVKVKMVSADVAMIVSALDSGSVVALFVRMSGTTITQLSRITLFSAAVTKLSLAKISDTQYLLGYQLSASNQCRRVITIPMVNVATPFTTKDKAYGVAITGGVVGTSITVSEPI